MKFFINILIFGIPSLTFNSCGQAHRDEIKTTVNAKMDTCDNPDAKINCYFVNMPSTKSHIMTIGDKNEPGEKLIISGTLFQADGKTPYANVIIYAYHTDNTGHYSKRGNETGVQRWHGHLHGWCKTDKDGRYEIRSIRPARYPGNTMPAHIHSAIRTENGETRWINDFVFKDDDLINEKYLSSINQGGGTGVVDVKKNSENVWIGVRDITIE